MKLAQLYASKFVASKRGFVDSYDRAHVAIPLLSILQLACELRTGSFVAAENQKIFEPTRALAPPFLMHNFLEKFHKITGSFIVILPPRSIISFSPTTELPYDSHKIVRTEPSQHGTSTRLPSDVCYLCLLRTGDSEDCYLSRSAGLCIPLVHCRNHPRFHSAASSHIF